MLLAFFLAATIAAPTPSEYYARALATMDALPQAKYATFEMRLRATGADVAARCSGQKAAFAIGWGSGMTRSVDVRGAYRAADDAAAFLENGTYCRDGAALFKPAWEGVHDWIRYGLSDPPRTPAVAARATAAPLPMQTIVSVTSLAPAAYDVVDMGAAQCPGGAGGHALHFIAKSNPDTHPLMDAIVETKTMRLCMVRLRLLGAVALGTGAKGDVVLDFSQSGPYWMVTKAHAAISLRMFGTTLKTVGFDMDYTQMAFPDMFPAAAF